MKLLKTFLVVSFLLVSLGMAKAEKSTVNDAKKSAATVKLVPQKKVNVVTTLGVYAALTRELGKSAVIVSSLTKADDDPHHVREKPTYKRDLRLADMVIQNGRSLELWFDLVIKAAANTKLFQGEKAHIVASQNVMALEVPTSASREQGDIHPNGNPHIWLSPSAVLHAAENIKKGLIANDSARKAEYEKNFLAFKKMLSEKMFGQNVVKAFDGKLDFLWRLHEGRKLESYLSRKKDANGKPLKVGGWLAKVKEKINFNFFTYHSVFPYFANDFGIKDKIVGQIEEKPGVAPTIQHKNSLIALGKQKSVKKIIAATYYRGNRAVINGVAREIGASAIFVRVDCSENQSYFDMMDKLINDMI